MQARPGSTGIGSGVKATPMLDYVHQKVRVFLFRARLSSHKVSTCQTIRFCEGFWLGELFRNRTAQIGFVVVLVTTNSKIDTPI